MIVGGLTTTKAEFNAGFPLAEQMQDSFLTLISRRAGSSADCDCLRITAGKETAAVPRVQGSFAYKGINTKKDRTKWGRLGVSPRSRWRRDKG